MTNLLELFQISLAYQAAAVQLMLGEANFFSQQLSLPPPHPIVESNLVEKIVLPPRFGLSGSFRTTNLSFGFWEGKLHSIARTDLFPQGNSLTAWFAELARQPSLLDKTQAYNLATQWLTAVRVDVTPLEQKFHGPAINQQKFNPVSPSGRIPPGRLPMDLPIFAVLWGDPFLARGEIPAVDIKILGTTKELMELRIKDLSLSHRPVLSVTDAVELEAQFPKTGPDFNSANLSVSNLTVKLTSTTTDAFLDNTGLRVRFFLGGEEAVQTLIAPERLTAQMVEFTPERWLSSPVALTPEQSRRAIARFLDSGTYQWAGRAPFPAQERFKFNFARGTNILELMIDPYISVISRRWNGQGLVEKHIKEPEKIKQLLADIFSDRRLF